MPAHISGAASIAGNSSGTAASAIGRSHEVFGIPAIEGNSGYFQIDLAGEEIAAATGIAVAAVTAVPPDAYALSRLPLSNPGAHGIDRPDDFVTWYPRILKSGPVPILDQRIAVTNATRFDLHPNPSFPRLGNFALDNFQRSTRSRDLRNTHRCHKAGH
jgi:hypothetical protein